MIVKNHGPRRTIPTRRGPFHFDRGQSCEVHDDGIIEDLRGWPLFEFLGEAPGPGPTVEKRIE